MRSFSFCLFLYILQIEITRTEDNLELILRERTQSDWQNVWHRETHSRCREKLVQQLYWACEKDIYRLTRRNRNNNGETVSKRGQPFYSLHWLYGNYSDNLMVRTRRIEKDQSITNECCTKAGCTWEEYAEYCPTNKRRNHY
ncbi:probable insulin-like peptide 7 [Teleopsis dalmanni]|uniref:probable insulin-like peptide 7 n=1 Tax=Teleopsis dalmanni TaxID=139649 RepID=UPI0018CCA7DE|nr:probable insulin-like peptide 7 [Teleopsis dalmanni]